MLISSHLLSTYKLVSVVSMELLCKADIMPVHAHTNINVGGTAANLVRRRTLRLTLLAATPQPH